jgi:hypothetical protein
LPVTQNCGSNLLANGAALEPIWLLRQGATEEPTPACVRFGMLNIRYLEEPRCSYKDYQVGTVAKKMPKPADESVRFTIGKSNETGTSTFKLTLFNKNAPQGVAYHRADMDQIASDAPKLDRAACNKAMTDAQRECDQRGGKQHEVLSCRNSAMMKYIGCL